MDLNIFSFTAFFVCVFICKSYALESNQHFTDEWAAEIEGGIDNARDVARRYGFIFVDKVCIEIRRKL
jgi:F0F1-type ATP synthase membrane subunit b/b'